MKDIFKVNCWSKEEKEFMKKVSDIFEWNGWSDNTSRYKL